ncbi:hypothetical protein FRC03_011407 [Tulasnella sp. 419]|nr:hypothetical protein FRC03_011407 [Tulasnella sp. 419]
MTMGLDRSIKLLEIAQRAGNVSFDREVIRGDALDNCWRAGAFDYAISIATIHHLTTPERRRQAVETLIRCLNPRHGRLMIYVWAIEQDNLSKRVIPDGDGDSDNGRDTLVPWVLAKPAVTAPGISQQDENSSGAETFHRYYHFFSKNELRELAEAAATELGLHIGSPPETSSEDVLRGVEVVSEGWERSNYYIEMRLWEINPQ